MSDMILEAKNLNKFYKTASEGFYALQDVSLSIGQSDYMAIIGPSGAGKSTLMHILGGLDAPSAGKLFSGAEDVYRLNDSQRAAWRNKNIGFVFQFFHLIEELSILENIAIAAFGRKSKEVRVKALELLNYLGIEKRAHFFPSQLSGGEKQKAAIARALINHPQLLLCDEPTGNLDHESQEKVAKLLEKLNKEQNIAVVLVTHNPALAARAKKIITMESGCVK
jgi:ABC-type lipoprotein export system ATPase subunit